MVKLSPAGKKALDDLVAQTQSEKKIPGFAIAVSSIHDELYASAGGYKSYDDPASGPVTPDTVFWICSMTKLITAVAGLQLVERGKLNFTDPISKYLPQFENTVVLEGLFTPNVTHKPAQSAPTVGQLFSHSSGLTYFAKILDPPYQLQAGYTFEQGPTRKAAQEEFLRLIREDYPKIPLAFEPDSPSFSYGFSSDVLGIIIEKITGLSLADYCEQNIFKPLGIETTFRLTAELKNRLMELSFRNADGSISRWENHTPLIQRYPKEVHLALGGIGAYSTLPDYLKLLRHLLQIEAGKEAQNPILKQETVKGLFQPQLSPAGAAAVGSLIRMMIPDPRYADTNYSTGLAISTKDWPGQRKANSAFWSGWAGTFYLMDPTTGIAFVTGTQIVPTMDTGASGLFSKVEEIVYANLED